MNRRLFHSLTLLVAVAEQVLNELETTEQEPGRLSASVTAAHDAAVTVLEAQAAGTDAG
jgi:hypothetical protein